MNYPSREDFDANFFDPDAEKIQYAPEEAEMIESWLERLAEDLKKSGIRNPRKYYNDRGESVMESIVETIPENALYGLAVAILSNDSQHLGEILMPEARKLLMNYVESES